MSVISYRKNMTVHNTVFILLVWWVYLAQNLVGSNKLKTLREIQKFDT